MRNNLPLSPDQIDLVLELISLDNTKQYIENEIIELRHPDLFGALVKDVDVYLLGVAFYAKCTSSSTALAKGELVIGFITNKSVLFEGEYHIDPDFYRDYEGWELYAYSPHKSHSSLSKLRLLASSDMLFDEDLHLDKIAKKYNLSVIKTF
tara:strand:+ start:1004 stop:1456 length:453 start_codon:yes stop_codon:yes gene_type:complete